MDLRVDLRERDYIELSHRMSLDLTHPDPALLRAMDAAQVTPAELASVAQDSVIRGEAGFARLLGILEGKSGTPGRAEGIDRAARFYQALTEQTDEPSADRADPADPADDIGRRIDGDVDRARTAAAAGDKEGLEAARTDLVAVMTELGTTHAVVSRQRAELEELALVDPARFASSVAELKKTEADLRAQLTSAADAVLRIHAGTVLFESGKARAAVEGAVAFMQSVDRVARDPEVTDRRLDRAAADLGAQARMLKAEQASLEGALKEARSVVDRLGSRPEDELGAAEALELRQARMTMAGVPDAGRGLVSLKAQIDAVRTTVAALEQSRGRIENRYQTLRGAVDAQLRSLGREPTTQATDPASLWKDLSRLSSATGAAIPDPPPPGASFGRIDRDMSAAMLAATERRARLLLSTAAILHSQFGVDVPAWNNGQPKLPGGKAADLAEMDRELRAQLATLAKLSGLSALDGDSLAYLSRIAQGEPVVGLEPPILTAINQSAQRMAFVTAHGLDALAAHVEAHGGSIDAGELRRISADPEADRELRETARAMVANPEFLTALTGRPDPAKDTAIDALSLRVLARRADTVGVEGHPRAFVARMFYARAARDTAELRSAIGAGDIGAVANLLGPLSQDQRQQIILEYGPAAISRDINANFSGRQLGWMRFYLLAENAGERAPLIESQVSSRGGLAWTDGQIDYFNAYLAHYKDQGTLGAILGTRPGEATEVEYLSRVARTKACRDEYAAALESHDPARIAAAKSALVRELSQTATYGALVLWGVQESTELAERRLRQAQGIANAVTITAAATAATLATAGALGPSTGAAAATAIGIAAGTFAGTATASLLSMGEQKLENGRVDWKQVGRDTRDGAAMAFTAAATAGISSLAMDGVMGALKGTSVMTFLRSGTAAANLARYGVQSAAIGAAQATATAAAGLGSAGLRAAAGDRVGAKRDLDELGPSVVRAGVGGMLLGPVLGRGVGVTGRLLDGTLIGAEQVIWNRMRGREASEGVAQAVINGFVIGQIVRSQRAGIAGGVQEADPASPVQVRRRPLDPAERAALKEAARSPSAPRTAVVIGAGPAGLISALELVKQGVRVTLVEQRDGVFTRPIHLGVRKQFLDQLAVIDPKLAQKVDAVSTPVAQRISIDDGGQHVSTPPLPTPPNAAEFNPGARAMLEGPSTRIARISDVETILFGRLKEIAAADKRAGVAPRVTILTEHQVNVSMPEGGNGPAEVSAQPIQMTRDAKGRAQRVPSGPDVALGRPDLVVVAEGAGSSTRGELDVPREALPGQTRFISGYVDEAMIADRDGKPAAISRFRAVQHYDPEHGVVTLRQVGSGHPATGKSWVLTEVPPSMSLASPAEIEAWYRSQAQLVMGLTPEQAANMRIEFGPILFRMQQNISSTALVGQNVYLIGDAVGNGHFLTGGGANTACVAHVTALRRLVQDLGTGVDPEVARARYNARVLNGTREWLRAGSQYFSRPKPEDYTPEMRARLEAEPPEMHLNIFGEGETTPKPIPGKLPGPQRFLDVATDGVYANGRLLTGDLPPGTAKEIIVRNAPLSEKTLSEIGRLVAPGGRVTLMQPADTPGARPHFQGPKLVDFFAGRAEVTQDRTYDQTGVPMHLVQIRFTR